MISIIFFSIEATLFSSSLHLTQTKYVVSILECTNKKDCKPCGSPTSFGKKLSSFNGDALSDSSTAEYHTMVGALQYLTFTRPGITYDVQQVCQFMHKPTTLHLQVVKRILWYIEGTLGADVSFQ